MNARLDMGPGIEPTTVQAYLRDTYEYKYSFIGWVAFILIGELLLATEFLGVSRWAATSQK